MTADSPAEHDPLFGRETPEIIVVGGGKGGAGRSTLAIVLARALVKRARRVVLVDADTTHPVLHRRLGLPDLVAPAGRGVSDPEAPLEPFVRQTHFPDLNLLSLGYARHFPFVRPKLDAPSLLDRFSALKCDAVIIDLPAGFDPVFMSIFALADTPILVTEPEIGALTAATQYLRAALFHGIGYHPNCYDAEQELLLLMRELPIHLDRNALLPAYLSASGRRVVYDTASKLVPLLVVNRVAPSMSAPQRRAYGDSLNLAWHHLLGVFPRWAGALTDRPMSDRATRRGAELVGSDPEVDALAEAVSQHAALAERYPRPQAETHTARGMLGLGESEEDRVVRARVGALDELLGLADSPLRLLTDSRRVAEVSENIAEALGRLPAEDADHDPEQPAPLKSSGRPDAPAVASPTPEPEPEPEPAPPAPMPIRVQSDTSETLDTASHSEPRPETQTDDEVDPDLPTPGTYLRDLRRSRGISLRELSLRTKIGLKYLEAIEAVDHEIMPRPVYLRGYLREIAQVFDIDETSLIDRYFGHLRQP